MILEQLTLDNFKNIPHADLCFSPKINAFLGNNGMGKSNLLDAIYYMSFCKSFTGMTDQMLIRAGEQFAMTRARYLRRGVAEELQLGLSGSARRKSLKRGGKEYDRLSDHIGLFPLVLVSPADSDLIRGAGDERRRFMDMVISQGDRLYLEALIRYNRALEQRNRLLRDGSVDHSLYMAVEISMAAGAERIIATRRQWTDKLSAIFSRYYAAIAGSGEQVGMTYRSTLDSGNCTFEQLLDSARRHDEIVRHTSVGPHRDDLELTLNGMPMRRTASQGQCKTMTIALRFAQYDFLKEAAGFNPLLLLDDIFDKLDTTRVERIMEIVEQPLFGQIFVTDTNRAHLNEIVGRSGGDHRQWEVADGVFTPMS